MKFRPDALGWERLQTPFGFGLLKEGPGDGLQHYTILFPEKKLGIVFMTNSDNGESIFKEFLKCLLWINLVPGNGSGIFLI
jgi:D-alanyl-D-alanine-carboxypeptidase/D-alanyl-D-alanine-endopeptidase